MVTWRWDQGRLQYFAFDNVRSIAESLSGLEGLYLRGPGDPLRAVLPRDTGLPFAPTHYRIWRNYARVFGCSLLATAIEGHLVITELCKRIVGNKKPPLDVDEYIGFIIKRFYYPSPIFEGYDNAAPQIFPFCAVIKYLIARYFFGATPQIKLNDVFSYVVGNEVTGAESVDEYMGLKKTSRAPRGDENRQVREMLIFASQLSLLKWYGNILYLDINGTDYTKPEELEGIFTPITKPRKESRQGEIVSMGAFSERDLPAMEINIPAPEEDFNFVEGKRVRVTHLRTERSPNVRRLFLANMPKPILCDGCTINSETRYPWTKGTIIEVHHLLPLSSALAINGRGIKFTDLVPVCPNCHKAVHSYYRLYLKENAKDDFSDREEANKVYKLAKEATKL